jgi:hypothetical protein
VARRTRANIDLGTKFPRPCPEEDKPALRKAGGDAETDIRVILDHGDPRLIAEALAYLLIWGLQDLDAEAWAAS